MDAIVSPASSTDPQCRATKPTEKIMTPQATVVQEAKQGTLAVLRFKGGGFTRPLAILHRKGRVLTPAMKKFIDILDIELPEAGGA